MPSPIAGVGSIAPVAVPSPITPSAAGGNGAFQKVLSSAISQVEAYRGEADVQVQKFLSGESQELHQVMLATQQAEISLELFQSVRNKVVQAYQEIMRMQM